MTSFGDVVFSQGVPLVGNGIPATYGTTYFVDADNGSDGNTGRKMNEAKKTVLAAYNLTKSDAHDVIVMTANAPHAIAATLAVSKNRVHFVGLGMGTRYMGQRTRWESTITSGTGIAQLVVTGVGNTFTNIKHRDTSTNSTNVFAVADGGEFTQFTNCSFEKDEDLNQTGAAELMCNGDTSFYKNCAIGNSIYEVSVARQNVLFTRETITGKVARDVIFEDCLFQIKTSASTPVNCRATANDIERMLLMRKCIFWSAKTSSATQALVWGVASALTDGQVLLDRCTVQNITNVGANTIGVYTNSAQPVADATESVAVHTA